MRPAYADLLRHPWIADMQGPGMIMEEDEDEEAESSHHTTQVPGVADKGFPEVRDWVVSQMEKRKKKVESGEKWGSEKPALHTVALDKVKSPVEDPSKNINSTSQITNGIEGMVLNGETNTL